MKKILIISYHFPPVNNINARRFGEMVFFMKDFGWEPIVLTTNSQGSLPLKISEDNVIRIGENYYKEGVISEQGNKGIPFIFKLPFLFYKKLGMEIISIDRFLFTWGKEVKKNIKKIKEINPDLIIASSYPYAPLWVGRFISRKIKKPWIADLQDPLSLWNNSKFPFIKFIDKKIDKYLMESASAILTLGSFLAQKMKNLYKRKVEIIYNGFDEPIIEDQQKNTISGGKIYYAGRFHLHRMPAIKIFIEWLAKDKKNFFTFFVRSLGPEEANDEIIRYAKEKGVLNKIKILPPTDPKIIAKEEKDAGILILFEDLNRIMPNSQGNLPGKLTEYLPFSAPIVAISRSDSEIGEILKETNRGYLVSSIDQLSGVMEDIVNGKNLKREKELIEKYSRRFQCKKLCEIFDKVYESKK